MKDYRHVDRIKGSSQNVIACTAFDCTDCIKYQKSDTKSCEKMYYHMGYEFCQDNSNLDL